MELIRPIVKVGNSAGVVLPRDWLYGEAQVTLLKKPANHKKEILDILEPYLPSILGVYIVGSYARGEQTSKSDMDVLVITDGLNKRITKGKYDLLMVSQDNLDKKLNDNILPLLPMIYEAVPIINSALLKEYRKTPLTRNNLKWHIETTKSALNAIGSSLELARDDNAVSDNIAYSLILRLRESHIVDSIMKNKKPTLRSLSSMIKKLTGSLEIYEAYRRSKSKISNNKTVNYSQAEAIYSHIASMIKEQEQWIKRNV